jgi:hypothetical protein
MLCIMGVSTFFFKNNAALQDYLWKIISFFPHYNGSVPNTARAEGRFSVLMLTFSEGELT